MEIKVGKTGGFCYGVKNAVENSEKQLANADENIYCLGELVHNRIVTDNLRKRGLIFIEDINDSNGKTIIRAHGVKKEIYDIAQNKNIELVDLTCPNVSKIHKIAQEYCNKNYFILLIGKKEHPEIIGTFSFCGKNSVIISSTEDVENALNKLNKTQIKNILIISQTTYNLKVFEDIVNEIKEKLDKTFNIEVKNTICLATELRQKETRELSKEVDYMIIVGGKNSSNTAKLYDISLEECKNVILIESAEELDTNEVSKYQTIGIMAGASTPEEVVSQVVEKIEKANVIKEAVVS